MLTWQRNAEPFCAYLHRRARRRRRLVALAYAHAQDDTTALLIAAKLAKALRVDIGSVKQWQQ